MHVHERAPPQSQMGTLNWHRIYKQIYKVEKYCVYWQYVATFLDVNIPWGIQQSHSLTEVGGYKQQMCWVRKSYLVISHYIKIILN